MKAVPHAKIVPGAKTGGYHTQKIAASPPAAVSGSDPFKALDGSFEHMKMR